MYQISLIIPLLCTVTLACDVTVYWPRSPSHTFLHYLSEVSPAAFPSFIIIVHGVSNPCLSVNNILVL